MKTIIFLNIFFTKTLIIFFNIPEFPGFKRQNSEASSEMMTIVMFSLGPILAVCVLVAPIAFIVIEKDPFYYILKDFLQNPKYRDNWAIIGGILFRVTIFQIASTEVFRNGSYLYTIAVVAFDRGAKY